MLSTLSYYPLAVAIALKFISVFPEKKHFLASKPIYLYEILVTYT